MFLEHVLQAYALPPTFIHWILECVTNPSFSILLNGKPKGFFKGKKGLRHGDPLSPYLFIMCMNDLSQLLDKATRGGTFDYHPKSKNLALTHLVFANDMVIFLLQIIILYRVSKVYWTPSMSGLD